MKKTDKKRENVLSNCLTEICDQAIEEYEGFQWITHRVNYSAFPKSLKIICVFDTNQNLKAFTQSHQAQFNKKIRETLNNNDIKLHDMGRQILYDTEELCLRDNAGHWGERLSTSV